MYKYGKKNCTWHNLQTQKKEFKVFKYGKCSMKTQVKLKKDFHTVVRASVLSRLHHCQVLYSGMTHASLRRLRAVKIMKLVGIFNLNPGLSALMNSLNSSFTLISNIHC